MSSKRRANTVTREGGAVAVEAALLLPLFILLLFGVLELALVVRDEVSVTSSVRTGIRTATTLPRTAEMTQATADSVQEAGSAMPMDYTKYLLVYEPNSMGFPLPEGNTTYECQAGYADRCDKFTWNKVGNRFNPTVGQSWDPSKINACPSDSKNPPSAATLVGVYMKAEHPMFTNFFGGVKTIDDRAVLRFEPMRPSNCKGPIS